MAKKGSLIAVALVMSMMLVACKSESTSSTTVNFSTTTDEGTKEYSYTSENNNGEVTEESSYSETPATEDADAEDAVAADQETNPALDEYANKLYDDLANGWDTDEGDGHRVTYDPDRLFVTVWQNEIATIDDITQEEIEDKVIPYWLNSVSEWRQAMDEEGLQDVGITFQYVYNDQDIAILVIEDGEVVYTVFD
ncbi:MAG: hypothetical protein IJ526_02905 [Lachnospiraceae bacterium]|nr:hypothetical protein [Lachnospiraceae bacterium]